MPIDEVILTFAEAAAAAKISLSTLRRQIAGGCGPAVVVLSPRRRGIRSDSFRHWLDGRTTRTHVQCHQKPRLET